jgi:hypothetical protein
LRAAGPEPALFRRVGFDRRFGVKLAVLWAEELGLPPISYGSKRFKWLKKLTGKD